MLTIRDFEGINMPDHEEILFEIPVYSMTQELFDKKFEEYIERQRGKYYEDEETRTLFRDFVFPMGVWRFNQIIGYIQIVATESYFKFLLWQGSKKKYSVDAKSKPMISLMDQCYVSYSSGESNEEFRHLLTERISRCYESFLYRHRYIDTTTFDNLVQYIDFSRIIKDAKKRD